MATVAKTKVIDSDAHVIESEHTWDYLLPPRGAVPPDALRQS